MRVRRVGAFRRFDSERPIVIMTADADADAEEENGGNAERFSVDAP